jgi:hypothetical protein
MRKSIIAALAVSTVLSIAACGSTMSTLTTHKAAATTPAATPATTPAPTPVAQTTTTSSSTSLTGPVGTPYTDTDAQNNEMSVTLTQVIDPAQGANEFDTPDNGNRFVGAKFKIAGISGSFSDDANSDAVVIGSDGQSYTPDFSDIAGCTNFNAGGFSVSPGTSATGCVAFQVPQGVTVASVQWGGAFGGTPATWTL